MLRQLLNFWFMPIFGTFFAAGATIDAGFDGGGDVSDTGDDGGRDATSDASSDADGDSGGDVVDERDADLSDADTAADESDGSDVDPDAPVELGDGRTVPGKIKKVFELAKKAGVEKEVKQLWFANQRLTKAIPGGVNAAIQLARDVEQMGGVEGIREIQTELGGYHEDSQLFQSGDARWSESGFQESPESAIKHTIHSLNYMQEHHPDDFDHIVAKYIVADLGNLDIRALHANLASQKDNPEAQKLAAQLANYYNSRRETAVKAPEKTPDAKNKELTERESKAQQAEMRGREAQARAEIKPALQNSIGAAVRAEGKARGLDLTKLAAEYKGEYLDLVSKIHAEVNRLTMQDERFLRNYNADLTKGDVARAAKRANAKHDEVIGDAVRAIFGKSGLFRGKNAAGAKPNRVNNSTRSAGGSSQGVTRVSERKFKAELRRLVDYDRSPAKDRMDGKYTLKDGRKIEVVY